MNPRLHHFTQIYLIGHKSAKHNVDVLFFVLPFFPANIELPRMSSNFFFVNVK